MWEAVSATAGIKGKGLITLQPRIGSILELHYSLGEESLNPAAKGSRGDGAEPDTRPPKPCD